jgi:hypothetical protein
LGGKLNGIEFSARDALDARAEKVGHAAHERDVAIVKFICACRHASDNSCV